MDFGVDISDKDVAWDKPDWPGEYCYAEGHDERVADEEQRGCETDDFGFCDEVEDGIDECVKACCPGCSVWTPPPVIVVIT